MEPRSKQHTGARNAALRFDQSKWQRIQDYLAKVIQANLCLLDSAGEPISRPSRVTPFSQDICRSSEAESPTQAPDGIAQAFLDWQHHGSGLTEWRGLGFASQSVGDANRDVGALIVGPIIIGKRKDHAFYLDLCLSSGIEPERFTEHIGELRVFSFTTIRVLRNLFVDIFQSLTVSVSTSLTGESKVKTPAGADIEGLLASSKTLPKTLLTIASRLVDAESGSIMFWNEEKQAYSIQAQIGLEKRVSLKSHISGERGVAAWVAARKEATLITRDPRDEELSKRMKRPALYASMVVPFNLDDNLNGLICLNAETSNHQFCKDSLVILDDLGKIAGLALAHTCQL